MNAYVCCISNTKYLEGLLVVYESYKFVKSDFPFYALIPKDEKELKNILIGYGINTIECDDIISCCETNHYFDNTFFKLNIFSLTQFDKIISLDCDLLLLHNIDSLFNKPHLSASVAGKIINSEWVEMCSGLLVIKPNYNDYSKLVSSIEEARQFMIKREGRKIIGDQDVIIYNNKDWPNKKELHLGEEYDEFFYCTEKLSKTLPNGFKDIKVLHFNGPHKPWQITKKEYFLTCLYYIKHFEFNFLRGYKKYRKFLKMVRKKYEQH